MLSAGVQPEPGRQVQSSNVWNVHIGARAGGQHVVVCSALAIMHGLRRTTA